MADKDFTFLIGKVIRLKGPSNYRTRAKDMEMCILWNECWTMVTSSVPENSLG